MFGHYGELSDYVWSVANVISALWYKPRDIAAKRDEGAVPIRHRAHNAHNDAGASVDYRLQR
jgi:hypothetical protein